MRKRVIGMNKHLRTALHSVRGAVAVLENRLRDEDTDLPADLTLRLQAELEGMCARLVELRGRLEAAQAVGRADLARAPDRAGA
jgi:hypothetical protein